MYSLRTGRQFWAVTVSLAVSVPLSMAAAAYGCALPKTLLVIGSRSSGPPGSEVMVQGIGLAEAPVELRWNATDGPTLTTTSGPDFRMPVTIPQVEDGLYSVVAVARLRDGGISNLASTPFQVQRSALAQSVGRSSEDSSPAVSRRSAGTGAIGGMLVVSFVAGVAGALLFTRRRVKRAPSIEAPM